MRCNLLVVLLVLFHVLFSLATAPVSAENSLWWNTSWSFRQELSIAFHTGLAAAKHQPVDTTVVFNNPCWAVDEQQHSIRVVAQDSGLMKVLESQVYGLQYTDDEHVNACNLVFLIPEEATGSEKYFIYYDESETSSVDYPDRVSIEDSYYFIEPIPGYPFQAHYFKISQDGSIIYTVIQDGKFMGYSTSQHVTKMKKGTVEVFPKNGDLFAAFDFKYYYAQGMFDYSSTSQSLVSKQIVQDGNLMVSCAVASTSKQNDLKTTAVYTYYYCPTEVKRIHTHVVHQVLEECYVGEGVNTDGTYAILQCGGAKSSSVEDLNFGEILPFLHVFTEENRIEEFPLVSDPEYIPDDPDIRILSTEDDIDLGEEAWASFSQGTQGIAHGLIFGSTSVERAGVDERDGIQVRSYELDFPHLPGLEGNTATLQYCRNSYERGGVHDHIIPEGFQAEYDAEFFSTTEGGYPRVQQEAALFQALVSMKPSVDGEISPPAPSTKQATLTVLLHDAPSFPFGSYLSVLTGKRFSYFTVELFQDTGVVCSGSATRVPLRPSQESEALALVKRVSTAIRLFDVRNMTLFKSITFSQLQPGWYLVKVFKENPGLRGGRQFVGYRVVELAGDAKIHVWCSREGSTHISVVDQHGTGVFDASVQIVADGMVLASNRTDESGVVTLSVPSGIGKRYEYRVLYKGFVVGSASFRFGALRFFVPLRQTVVMERYDWSVTVVDSWGLPPEMEVSSQLTSAAMVQPLSLAADQRSPGVFVFSSLVPASYDLRLQYKSFVVDETVVIPSADKERLVFPAVFPIHVKVMDVRGSLLGDAVVRLSRGGKIIEETYRGSEMTVILPPGTYTIDAIVDGVVVSTRSLTVLGERTVEMITSQEPLFPLLVFVGVGVFLVCSVFVCVVRKHWLFLPFLVSVAVVLVALVMPWWSLSGSSAEMSTSTEMYMMPLQMVTTMKTQGVLAGELAYFTDLFIIVMTIVPLVLLSGCFILLAGLALKGYGWKRFSLVSMVGALVLLIMALAVFSYVMTVFTDVGVGSLVGQGALEVTVPGSDHVTLVSCSWGPGIGFYLTIVSLGCAGIALLVIRKKG